jgi:hypothetical protein
MRNNNRWFWLLLVVAAMLALALAACGDDDDDATDDNTGDQPAAEESDSPDEEAAAPDLGGLDTGLGPDLGPDLGAPGPGPDAPAGLGGQLPGCSDPDSEECPAPVDLPGPFETVTVEGVSLDYPSRYFNAATSPDAPDGVLIELTPSENLKYEQTITVQVYFAESVEDALSDLSDPESAPWSTETLDGTIAVSRDDEADPPTSVAVGAFPLADDRVVVLRAETTGEYGWDLYVLVYETLLNTLTVA